MLRSDEHERALVFRREVDERAPCAEDVDEAAREERRELVEGGDARCLAEQLRDGTVAAPAGRGDEVVRRGDLVRARGARLLDRHAFFDAYYERRIACVGAIGEER